VNQQDFTAAPHRPRKSERWLLLFFLCSLPFLNPWVRGDGVGYYAFARAPLIEHSLDFTRDYQHANESFRGPRLDNLDLSIVKTTKISERVSVQLRGEFFNVLNHPHFMNPNTLGYVDPSDPSTFGVIAATPDVAAANPVIGTGGPRNIQLGLKFRF